MRCVWPLREWVVYEETLRVALECVRWRVGTGEASCAWGRVGERDWSEERLTADQEGEGEGMEDRDGEGRVGVAERDGDAEEENEGEGDGDPVKDGAGESPVNDCSKCWSDIVIVVVVSLSCLPPPSLSPKHLSPLLSFNNMCARDCLRFCCEEERSRPRHRPIPVPRFPAMSPMLLLRPTRNCCVLSFSSSFCFCFSLSLPLCGCLCRSFCLSFLLPLPFPVPDVVPALAALVFTFAFVFTFAKSAAALE